jgi:hypothetical protein
MTRLAKRSRVLAELPAILAVGLVSVVCATIIAHLVGVADAPGPDWAEWAIQALALCIGMTLLAYRRRWFRVSGQRASRPR